ncbi:MAG TPA: hypothetical protein VHB21_13525, partial [Minicystis sp.]|nr:hypothetical protein [Minicystis sp.]
MKAGGPGRARRAIGAAAKAAGLGATFAVAVAGGALLHVGLPAPRRFVVARVDAALDGSFKGRIVVRDLAHLSLAHLDGLAVEVFDPEGHRVLLAEGVDVRVATATLVASLLGKGDLRVELPRVEIDYADVTLDANGEGKLGIARAFEPAKPSTSPGRATAVKVSALTVEHAWVHGTPAASAPYVDADVDQLAGALATSPRETRIDLDRALLKTRGLEGKNPDGAVRAHATLPADGAEPTVASAAFDGHVGAVAVHARAAIDGRRVDAVLDVPEAAAADVRALAPGIVTVSAPVSLHAEAHGALPLLTPELTARVGAGTVHATGEVRLPDAGHPATEISALIATKDVDARAIAEGAPATRVTASLDAHVVLRGGHAAGDYRLDVEPGEAAGQAIPAAALAGSFTDRSISGSGHVAEPGAPTDLRFSARATAGEARPTLVDVDATARVDLARVRRVKGLGKGEVDARVEAHVDLASKSVRASAAGSVRGYANGNVALARGRFQGSVDGTFDRPRFVARLDGRGLSAAGTSFTAVRASAFGSPAAMSVAAVLDGGEDGPSIDARGVVSTGAGVLVRGARVRVRRGDETTTATVAALSARGGFITVDGLRVEGLGAPIEGSFAMRGKTIRVKANGDDLDLARVAALFARPEDVTGHLAFEVDLSTDRRGLHGLVDAKLDHASYATIDDANARVTARFDGPRVDASVDAALGDAGKVALETRDLRLGGSALAAASWAKATGSVLLDASVDLARVAALVPRAMLPLDQAAGAVTLRGEVARASERALPTVELHGATRGLVLVGRQTYLKDAAGEPTLG